MAHAQSPNPEAFDELDPHGFSKPGHGVHESHVIVGPFTLRAVLAILLMFTVLTVAFAQAEVWAQHYFDIVLPWWVNVAVAMSIAVVKAVLVMAYFMQLKYDNPINTVLMLFTFAALAIFIFFTGLDLFTRGEVDERKSGQVVPGGSGLTDANKRGKPMVENAMLDFVERVGQAEYDRIKAALHIGHGAHAEHGVELSTPSRSRPRTGLSGVLGGPGTHGHAGEGHAPPPAPAPAH
jgi:cytochrome c oxidase subunit 4